MNGAADMEMGGRTDAGVSYREYIALIAGVLAGGSRIAVETVLAVALDLAISKYNQRALAAGGRVINCFQKKSVQRSDVDNFVSVMLINGVLTSMKFCYKWYFLTRVYQEAMRILYRRYLWKNWETGVAAKPFIVSNRISRNAWLVRDAVETLLYDIIFRAVKSCVHLHALAGMAKADASVVLFLAVGILLICHVSLSPALGECTSKSTENNEQVLAEVNDIYGNPILAKMADEKERRRVAQVFRPGAHLKAALVKQLCAMLAFSLLLVPHIFILNNRKLISVDKASLYITTIVALRASLSACLLSIMRCDAQRWVPEGVPGEPKAARRDCRQVIGLESKIELVDVSIYIGRERILQNLNFVLERPAVLGVSGANGSGKSVFLRFLLGFLASHRGTVRVDGKEVAPENSGLREMVGYCPPDPYTFPTSIFDHIRRHSDTLESIMALLETYGVADAFVALPDGLNTPMDSLNKADLEIIQISNILKALNREAEAVMLDEAFTYVSERRKWRMLREILRNRNNQLILVVLHDSGMIGEFPAILQFHDSTATLLRHSE